MTTPRKIRTAVIGCGKVGATHAGAWSHLAASEFVAVCDVDADRAGRMAAHFGVESYTDAREMFRRARVEAVSVATPHPLHVPAIEAAAEAGVHALCEKPLAVDLSACDRALAAVRKAGTMLGVISQRRFYECVRRVKYAIEEGRIGRPILATAEVLGWRDEAYYQSDPWRGTWAGEGGGVMVSQCTHQLDLLLWLMGPIRELFGYYDTFNHPYIEVEDTAAALMRFESGAIGVLLLSNSQQPGLHGKVHVYGASGASVGVQVESGSPFISGVTRHADPPFNDLWTVPGEEALFAEWQREDLTRSCDVMTYYHERQFEDFLAALLESRPPLVTGEDGRAVVELFTAVYRSQREGRPLRFPLESSSGVSDVAGN